ncbi:MAG: adenylyltransferase/cytidyltransferase family protein [Candidatus Bathyarchaeia archaeon]
MAKPKVVLTTGVFDILHTGHLMLLERAKALAGPGGRLVVVVARDSTVEKRKGSPPIMPEEERRRMVEALKPVDEALLGHQDFSIGKVLEEVKPDIIVFGYDQRDLEEETRRFAKERGLLCEVVRLPRFAAGMLNSGSKIKERIAEMWKPDRFPHG